MEGYRKGIDSIASVHANINKWMTMIAGAVVLILCLYTTGDVMGRYLHGYVPGLKPLPASWELTLIFIVVITFFAVGYVQVRGGHMRLEFIWKRFGPRGQAILDLFSLLVGLFLYGIVTWQVAQWALDAWVKHEAMLGVYRIPYFPPRLALAIGAFSLSIQYIIDIIRCVGKLSHVSKEDTQ